MPKIHILPESLTNIIAAGEVIERPASVVKELLENAIDAGSTEVSVEVVSGGKRLIKLSDNGEGMERDDARMCFHRHATSKIESHQDLFNIQTMGFRGEALAAIASVAKVRLSTAPRGAREGVLLEVIGGEVRTERIAPASGTSIEVRDLFFNMPVRKKFLKSDHTELVHIIDAITKAAIICNEIGFKLVADGRVVIDLFRAESFRERIVQLYGTGFLEGFREIVFSDEEGGFSLSGYVSKPGNVRRTRTSQYLFVNRRPVTDVTVRHAIYKAYDDGAGKDSHPMFILDLRIDPARVDVNVHPTKREVRFLEKDVVYNRFLESIKGALRDHGFKQEGVAPGPSHVMGPEHRGIVSDASVLSNAERPSPGGFVVRDGGHGDLLGGFTPRFIYLGDVFVAYPDEGGLWVIDHHAAHERVLYERLRKREKVDVTRLLFPRPVRLHPKEYAVVLRYAEVLGSMGIEVEDFGGNTVIVRTIPDVIDEAAVDGILSDISMSIMDITANSPLEVITDAVAKGIACHGSVRGARILGDDQMRTLLRDLDMADDPHHCPHGRPTRIRMSLDELRRLFERT
ncbi:MAG: DNA mismatch repair endonuclease MutL [Thermodesulfovibrionales bacterium]